MKYEELRRIILAAVVAITISAAACAQQMGTEAAAATQSPAAAGGRLYGVVKSGQTPLPGVTVTARNTLTGKRVATTTDLRGAWSLALSQNGRYVVRSEFAGFAAGVSEALFNATSHEQVVNFDLQLASRAAAVAEGEERTPARAVQPMRGTGAQSVNLENTLAAGTEVQSAGESQTGAVLPMAATSADFSTESVAISGQSGQVSALAGMDMDRMRDAMESMRAQGGGLFGFGGPGGGFGAPGGGFGGPGMGGTGGRGNFRGFNAGQPHGSVFWQGSNSALNAQPFSLTGQTQSQPASGTNRFGLSFMSAPYIPGWTKPSGKDTVFLSISGQRSSTPLDEYATVPTAAERAGDFTVAGLPKIYDPTTLTQFVAKGNAGIADGTANVIPAAQIAAQATALLGYMPLPNLSQAVNNYNYHLLSTEQSNQTQIGARYMRTLGKNASMQGMGRGGFGGGRRTQNQGLRQSLNFNYNWSHSASDAVNLYPALGGKTWTSAHSLQAGYTLGYHKWTSMFNVNWNRSHAETTNFFTHGEDIATSIGILGVNSMALNTDPINYGLPNVTMSSLTGLSEQQPSFSIQQTISASETLSWIHGKHNLRFGGDYRRVHRDFLGGSNATGSFSFTGVFTENAAGDASTGSAVADLLLGLPQSTSLNASASKSYLRDNVFDLFAMDDWRLSRAFTANFGVRYEFYAPYTEKFGHLAMVDTNAAGGFTSQTEAQAGQTGASSGKLPDGLVFPYRKAVAPRLGVAWRVPRIAQMVVRAGYGVNFLVGQYGSFASMLAHQPMPNDASFVNEQTNTVSDSSCARGAASNCRTLGSGFSTPATVGNFALDPHYQLPHVQAWNVNVQKGLPWGILLNAGYNGSKGGDLDIKSAPWASTTSPLTNPGNLSFTYEQAVASSRFHAGTLSVQKRLSGGLALGAFYKYAHGIDNTVSMAQNWQDLQAEEGNSSTDVRHAVSGNYLYQLPFGPNGLWLTTGKLAQIFDGLSISGTFQFATGTPLTPSYQASRTEVGRGTAGTERPDRVAGQSLTAGGGSLKKWFNTAAFTTPAGSFGTASRNSIAGPGTVANNLTLSKTMRLGSTRSWELRATSTNVLNTVQYAGVDTNAGSPTFGQVKSVSDMRKFQFESRFRF